jgi:hypothetical protein
MSAATPEISKISMKHGRYATKNKKKKEKEKKTLEEISFRVEYPTEPSGSKKNGKIMA